MKLKIKKKFNNREKNTFIKAEWTRSTSTLSHNETDETTRLARYRKVNSTCTLTSSRNVTAFFLVDQTFSNTGLSFFSV